MHIVSHRSLLCRIFAVTCRKQLMLLLVVSSASFQFIAGQKDDVIQIFQNCHKRSPDFDSCVKRAFNDLIVFFKTGEDYRRYCLNMIWIIWLWLYAHRHPWAWYCSIWSASIAVCGTTARHHRWLGWLSITTDRCLGVRLGQFESHKVQVSEIPQLIII